MVTPRWQDGNQTETNLRNKKLLGWRPLLVSRTRLVLVEGGLLLYLPNFESTAMTMTPYHDASVSTTPSQPF